MSVGEEAFVAKRLLSRVLCALFRRDLRARVRWGELSKVSNLVLLNFSSFDRFGNRESLWSRRGARVSRGGERAAARSSSSRSVSLARTLTRATGWAPRATPRSGERSSNTARFIRSRRVCCRVSLVKVERGLETGGLWGFFGVEDRWWGSTPVGTLCAVLLFGSLESTHLGFLGKMSLEDRTSSQ